MSCYYCKGQTVLIVQHYLSQLAQLELANTSHDNQLQINHHFFSTNSRRRVDHVIIVTQIKIVSLNFPISKSCRLLGIVFLDWFWLSGYIDQRCKLFKDNIVFIKLVKIITRLYLVEKTPGTISKKLYIIFSFIFLFFAYVQLTHIKERRVKYYFEVHF